MRSSARRPLVAPRANQRGIVTNEELALLAKHSRDISPSFRSAFQRSRQEFAFYVIYLSVINSLRCSSFSFLFSSFRSVQLVGRRL